MSVAKPLSIPMRDLLIEHIDGPVPITGRIRLGSMTENTDVFMRCRALTLCFDRGWLAPDRKVSPTSTLLTDQGREVICEALADWADALSRANWSLELGGLIPERRAAAEQKS